MLRLFDRRSVHADDYLALIDFLVEHAELTSPTGTAPESRDDDDRKYLHCASFANADYLLSYDRDLLDVGAVGDTLIRRPEEFMESLEAQN